MPDQEKNSGAGNDSSPAVIKFDRTTDLRKVKLSDHFSLAELTRHSSTPHLDNFPPLEIVSRLTYLCRNGLEDIRAVWGAVLVHSGYRSDEVNAAVGGAVGSQHRLGFAADFTLLDMESGGDLFQVAKWIALSIQFDQLILEFIEPDGRSGGWIHYSLIDESAEPNRSNRKEILAAKRNKFGHKYYEAISIKEIPTAE